MAKRVFVAATGQNCGKTTTSLLLMRAAQRKFGRVGFMKPVGQEFREVDGLIVDKDALLMADVFGLRPFLKHMSPVVADRHFTRRCLDGEVRKEELIERTLESFKVLDESFDALVIEGTGHSGVGSVFGLNNAFVAKLLDAPVAMVTGGGIGQVIDLVELALPLYRREGAAFSAVIANKLVTAKRDQSLTYLRRAFEPQGIQVLGGLNFSPKLANPSLKAIARLLKLDLHGNAADASRLVGSIHLGIASAQRVVDLLQPDTLVVTASTRDALLLTMAAIAQIPEYRPQLVGVCICGSVPVSPVTQRIIDASGIPYLRTDLSSTEVSGRLKEFVAKLSPDDTLKLDWLFETGQQEVSDESLTALFTGATG